MKINCSVFTFAVVVGSKAAHRGGLGELTPVNRVAPPILIRFVIGFPLTRKAENTRKRANVLPKLSAVKTGVIDQDSRKGNEYHIS